MSINTVSIPSNIVKKCSYSNCVTKESATKRCSRCNKQFITEQKQSVSILNIIIYMRKITKILKGFLSDFALLPYLLLILIFKLS